MREVVLGTQFKRDVKLAEKRGKNTAKLRELILLLPEGAPRLRGIAIIISSALERILICSDGIATHVT